jgi:hypothetical protein
MADDALIAKSIAAIETKNIGKIRNIITEFNVGIFPEQVIIQACQLNNLEIMHMIINPQKRDWFPFDYNIINKLKHLNYFPDIIYNIAHVVRTTLSSETFCRLVITNCDANTIKKVIPVVNYKSRYRSYSENYGESRLRALLDKSVADLEKLPDDLLPVLFNRLPQNILIHLRNLLLISDDNTRMCVLLNMFLKQYEKLFSVTQQRSYVVNYIILPEIMDYTSNSEVKANRISVLISNIKNVVKTIKYVLKVNKEVLEDKCNKLLIHYISHKNREPITFLFSLMKAQHLHITDTLGQLIIEKNFIRQDIVIISLSTEYYNQYFYKNLDKQCITNLIALQKKQLKNLIGFLQSYISEKGVIKIVSNYIGISDILT